MTERDDKAIFQQSWFTRTVFAGIDATLQGDQQAAANHQDFLINTLLMHLLDQEKSNPDMRQAAAASFFAFCQRNIHRSHAQILQDLWVLYMTAEKQGGFFVEFGACDGNSLSNTLLLEQDYGWKGILAEPDPIWHDALSTERQCTIIKKCVTARSGDEVDFLHISHMPELSRIADIVPDDIHERDGSRADQTVIKVPTISLQDLLKEHDAPKVIDYLSVDTEGSEYEILKAFDFSAYSFRLVSVEHAGENEKRRAIRELMARHGYNNWMPQLTRWEDWFIGPSFEHQTV